MKDNKKMAIICWVLSGLFLGGTILMYEGEMNTKVIFDSILTIVWAFTGFRYWKRKDQKNMQEG